MMRLLRAVVDLQQPLWFDGILITNQVRSFSNFSCMFLYPKVFSRLNSNCSNLLDMRNLQEQVKKPSCYLKLFWPFIVQTNCSRDLKIFANSRLKAENFKKFSPSLEQFFLTVGQNNFGNKIGVKIPWIKFTLISSLLAQNFRLFLLILWIIVIWHNWQS
jgi:hypothetical protein